MVIDLVFTEAEIVAANQTGCDHMGLVFERESETFAFDRGVSNREALRVTSVTDGRGAERIWSTAKWFKGALNLNGR